MAHKGNAQLTATEVYQIRKQITQYERKEPGGVSPRDIALYYGMSLEAIRRIARRETWAHLLEAPVMTPTEEEEAKERFRQLLVDHMNSDISKEREEQGKVDTMLKELTGRTKDYLGK